MNMHTGATPRMLLPPRAVWVAVLLLLLQTPAAAQHSDPERFRGEIDAFLRADSVQMPPSSAVLFVGSSSIRMWDSLADDFPGHSVIRRGFGGSEFSDLLYYANQIVFPYAPRLILVYEGDNDINAGKSPAQVYGDYREFVGRVRERLPGTRVGFIAIKPSVARWALYERMREANALIEGHAASDTMLFYVDVASPMLGANGQPRESLFQDDGLHLNADGYALWTRIVEPYLER